MKIPKYLAGYTTPILLAVCTTLFFGFFYSGLRQVYRESANDPQLQLIRDAVIRLERGESITDVVPQESIDIADHLQAFVNIYDAVGTPVNGSGTLRGALPKISEKIIRRTSKTDNQYRTTWTPDEGPRMALIVEPYKTPTGSTGFVASARSLTETDRRIFRLGVQLFIGWTITLLCIGGYWYMRKRVE